MVFLCSLYARLINELPCSCRTVRRSSRNSPFFLRTSSHFFSHHICCPVTFRIGRPAISRRGNALPAGAIVPPESRTWMIFFCEGVICLACFQADKEVPRSGQ